MRSKKIRIIQFILSLLVAMFFIRCNTDDPDIPPMNSIHPDSIINIGEIRQMIIPGETHRFDDSGKQVYAVVTMDEKNGNIYRQAYIEDTEGGINVRMHVSTSLNKGDSIRIALKGAILSYFNNMLQLDSVDGEANIVIQDHNRLLTPYNASITEILEGNLQARLITIDGVQFVSEDLNKTWADGVNLTTLNRTLQDCDNNTIIVRTSGYASFANDTLPEGNGSFTGIVTQYRDTWQLIVRDPAELTMANERCEISLNNVTVFEEDFDSDLGSFTAFSITGPQQWNHVTFDGGSAYMNGYSGSAQPNEDWLISPSIDLTGFENPRLQIREAINYLSQYDDIKVMISSDYDGSDPVVTGTWEHLTGFTRPQGNNWTYMDSGDMDISLFTGQTIYVALKYNSTTSGASGWQVSRIRVVADEL